MFAQAHLQPRPMRPKRSQVSGFNDHLADLLARPMPIAGFKTRQTPHWAEISGLQSCKIEECIAGHDAITGISRSKPCP